MPTIPERLAIVETKVDVIQVTTHDIKHDVKLLLAWRDEERGERRQRASTFRLLGTGLTVGTILINIMFRVVDGLG